LLLTGLLDLIKITFLSHVFLILKPYLKKTPKSLTAKFIDFFSLSQRKSIPEGTFSPIEKPIFEPVTFPEDVQIQNLVCPTSEAPVLTNQPSKSALENYVRSTRLIETVINKPNEDPIADAIYKLKSAYSKIIILLFKITLRFL
jgi:hypothetical protein